METRTISKGSRIESSAYLFTLYNNNDIDETHGNLDSLVYSKGLQDYFQKPLESERDYIENTLTSNNGRDAAKYIVGSNETSEIANKATLVSLIPIIPMILLYNKVNIFLLILIGLAAIFGLLMISATHLRNKAGNLISKHIKRGDYKVCEFKSAGVYKLQITYSRYNSPSNYYTALLFDNKYYAVKITESLFSYGDVFNYYAIQVNTGKGVNYLLVPTKKNSYNGKFIC